MIPGITGTHSNAQAGSMPGISDGKNKHAKNIHPATNDL